MEFPLFPNTFPTHTCTDSRSRWWPTKDAAFSERNIIPFLAAFSMLSRYHRRTSSLEEASYPVGKPAPCKNLDKSDISDFRLGIQFPRMSSSVFRCRGGHDRELSASILITNEPSLLPFPCFDSLFRFEKERWKRTASWLWKCHGTLLTLTSSGYYIYLYLFMLLCLLFSPTVAHISGTLQRP